MNFEAVKADLEFRLCRINGHIARLTEDTLTAEGLAFSDLKTRIQRLEAARRDLATELRSMMFVGPLPTLERQQAHLIEQYEKGQDELAKKRAERVQLALQQTNRV